MSILTALGVVFGLAMFSLRRPLLLPLQILPALVGLAVVSVATVLVFKSFPPSSWALLLAVLILTAEHGLHMLMAVQRSPRAPGVAVCGARLPVWMSALAAAGSAAAVLFVPAPDRVPIMACLVCAVLAAGAFAVLALPRLVPSSGGEVRALRWDLDAWAGHLERWAQAHLRLLAWCAALLLIVSAWGLARWNWGGDPSGKEILTRSYLAIGMAGLMVFFSTLRLEWGLVMVLSLGTGSVLTLGSLAWLGLDPEHLRLAAPVVTGLGAAWTVFRSSGGLAEWRGRPLPGGSVLFASVQAMAAAGVMAFSGPPSLRGAGIVLAVSIVWSLSAAMLLVPVLMRLFLPADPIRPPETIRSLLGSRPPSSASPSTVPEVHGTTDRAVQRMIKARYTYLGARVEQYVHWKLLLDPVYSLAAPRLPKTGLILDLGCGYGLMSHWAALTGPERRIFGVDHDERKLSVARWTARFEQGLSFQLGDLLESDLPLAQAGLMLDILHYSHPDLQAELLRKAASALVPGGSLVVCETCLRPRKFSWAVFWDSFSMRIGFNPDRGGMNLADLPGWKKRFENAGLRVAAADPCGRSRYLFLLEKPI